MNRILLVEDDCLSNLALGHYLRDAGFEVEEAFSGLAAVEAIRREPPHSLATNLDLGPGPDGFEIARYARWRRPLVRVVYISSEPPRFPAAFCEDSSFIPKPYRAEQIVDVLWRPAAPTVEAA